MRERLLTFYSHLKTEEHMSKLYERNQAMAGGAYDQDETQVSAAQALESEGNLVDDILNGDYEEDAAGDDLLADEEHTGLAEMEHLN